jgi:hypothetical protein
MDEVIEEGTLTHTRVKSTSSYKYKSQCKVRPTVFPSSLYHSYTVPMGGQFRHMALAKHGLLKEFETRGTDCIVSTERDTVKTSGRPASRPLDHMFTAVPSARKRACSQRVVVHARQ